MFFFIFLYFDNWNYMHQYFNLEYSAGFMNIRKIIPYKCLQIRFKNFSWHTDTIAF